MTSRLIRGPRRRQLILEEGPMGEIRVKVKLTNLFDLEAAEAGMIRQEKVRSLIVNAIVDTGAVRSALPRPVLEQLGVRIVGRDLTVFADGREEAVERTSGISFEVLGRETKDEALVLGDEVLIGQTILEKLDLLADCKNGRLVPNPDHPDFAVNYM